jgi:hypothetical protein
MKTIMAILACLGLGACQVTAQQASIAAGAVVAGNTAGAAVAGIVNPAVAVPAGAVAAIGNGLACSVSALFGGGC